MKLLFYANETGETGHQLYKTILPFVDGLEINILRTFESLVSALVRPRHGCSRIIAILVAESRSDITAFLSIEDLLFDVRVILILAEKLKKSTSEGFLLKPRYLSYADSDFADISAVLDKMIRQGESQQAFLKTLVDKEKFSSMKSD